MSPHPAFESALGEVAADFPAFALKFRTRAALGALEVKARAVSSE